MSSQIFKDIKRIKSLLVPEKKNYFVGLSALFFVNIGDAFAPLFLGVTIDLMTSQFLTTAPKTPFLLSLFGLSTSSFTIFSSIAVFLVLHLIANVSRYPMLMFTSIPSHRIAQRVRNSITEKLLRLSQSFFDREKTGELMAKATSDVNAMRMLLGPGILVGLDTVFILSMVMFVLFSLSWKLTLVCMLPLPLIGIVTNFLSHREYNQYEEVQKDLADLTEKVRESYSGIKILQAYAQEKFEQTRFAKASRGHYQKNMKLATILSFFEPTLVFFIGLSTCLVVFYGGLQVVSGDLTLGTFVAFLFLVGYLAGPMMGMGWSLSLFQRGRASLKRIDILLDEEEDIQNPLSPKKAEGKGELVVQNLSFSYIRYVESEESNREVEKVKALEDVSFSVPAGTTLGIIGPVGSGKSTLVKLLVRLYNAPPGSIRVDGVSVEEMTLEELRKTIVLAPQETFLFSNTIEKNIAFGSLENEWETAHFAKLAHIHDEIKDLKEGYETLLGEKGVNLSGGQRQRLAIARAIATDPPVLVLDDCLSAVDAKTEDAILQNLRTVFEKRTGIIISHRICAVQDCDQILVFESGKITARGTHTELLQSSPFYANISEKQTNKSQNNDK